MRVALVFLVAGGLLLAVTASGQEPAKVGRALATVYTAYGDPQGEIFNDEPGTTKNASLTDFADDGVTIANGEATSTVGTDADAKAYVIAEDIDLLDGRVIASSARRTASLQSDGHVNFYGRVTGLEIDGQFFGEIDGSDSIPLSGGGKVILNSGNTALRLVLADAEPPVDLSIAVARASQKDAPTPTPTPTPTPERTSTPTPTATPTPDTESKADKAKAKAKAKRQEQRERRKRLRTGAWDFPVVGNARVADNFGASRAAPIVVHKGVDIFAPFGSPVIAVNDGTLSHVGTLPISGNRLWLTTEDGDAFFYAHLSAFAPDAREGAQVEAGTVLGYAGNTGDAEPTPPHLHFEVHPGGEKQKAVDPYPIVTRWQDDVPGAHQLADSSERPGSLVTVRDFLAE
jgi:murein DD-endopeptidase MepM/ murein hydrolase activator NlpD